MMSRNFEGKLNYSDFNDFAWKDALLLKQKNLQILLTNCLTSPIPARQLPVYFRFPLCQGYSDAGDFMMVRYRSSTS